MCRVICQVSENGRDTIAGSYRCHQSGPKGFECLGCFRRFTQKTTVVDHVRYYCGKPPGYACSFCGFRARSDQHCGGMVLRRDVCERQSHCRNLLLSSRRRLEEIRMSEMQSSFYPKDHYCGSRSVLLWTGPGLLMPLLRSSS